MKKLNLNVIIGIFVLIFGIVLFFDKLNMGINLDYSIMFWAFLSTTGLIMIINDRKISTMPSILTFIGIWQLLKKLDIINSSVFSLFWPIILIIVGANLVFGRKLFNRTLGNIDNNSSDMVYNGVFSGIEQRLNSKDFKGLTANAIFGGVELDLRDIEISNNVQIDTSALFGGVTIILPEKYNLVIGESVALFGGLENKFKGQYDENRKTIYINSKVMFGGTELK